MPSCIAIWISGARYQFFLSLSFSLSQGKRCHFVSLWRWRGGRCLVAILYCHLDQRSPTSFFSFPEFFPESGKRFHFVSLWRWRSGRCLVVIMYRHLDQRSPISIFSPCAFPCSRVSAFASVACCSRRRRPSHFRTSLDVKRTTLYHFGFYVNHFGFCRHECAQAWESEIAERLEKFESGQSKLVDAKDAVRRIDDRLRR